MPTGLEALHLEMLQGVAAVACRDRQCRGRAVPVCLHTAPALGGGALGRGNALRRFEQPAAGLEGVLRGRLVAHASAVAVGDDLRHVTGRWHGHGRYILCVCVRACVRARVCACVCVYVCVSV